MRGTTILICLLLPLRLVAKDPLKTTKLGMARFHLTTQRVPEGSFSTKKSPAKALLLSAVLPGAGEFYTGSIIKGILFLGLEVGAWTGYYIYYNKGKDKEDEYKAFADRHWDYFRWIASGDTAGTHHIPLDERGNPIKNDDYYEMIGKYEQFLLGWDDWTLVNSDTVSARRLHYMDMRHKSNIYLKRALLGVSIAMANHVLSALDAAWSASRYNRRTVKMSLRVEMNRQRGPMAVLRLRW